MKFNCGLTASEQYFRAENECDKLNEDPQWKRVFAWVPVRVNTGDCRWFEYVEQRKSYYRVALNWKGDWVAKPRTIQHREIEK